LETKEIALMMANVANDKKGADIVILDIRGISVIADYFVICSGNSETQVQAISTAIKDKASENGILVKNVEGYREARWILLDLGDVVVNVMHKDEREYYKLERLWADAKRIELVEQI